jgi:hypothetical protein
MFYYCTEKNKESKSVQERFYLIDNIWICLSSSIIKSSCCSTIGEKADFWIFLDFQIFLDLNPKKSAFTLLGNSIKDTEHLLLDSSLFVTQTSV